MNLHPQHHVAQETPRALLGSLRLLSMVLLTILTSLSLVAKAEITPQDSTFSLEQTNISNFMSLRTDAGLSSNNVNVFLKDNTGMIWVGTDDGLNSYDGYEIRHFLPDEKDTTTISGKLIFEIRELDENRIVIAMGDGGVNYFDKRTRTFTRSYVAANNMLSVGAYGVCVANGYIYAVFPDYIIKQSIANGSQKIIDNVRKRPKNGVKWGRIKMAELPGARKKIAMLNGSQSLCLLDTQNDSAYEINLGKIYMHDICPKDSNSLFLATSNGIYTYNLDTKKFSSKIFMEGHQIHAVGLAQDNNCYWLAFDGNTLVKWDQGKNTLLEITNSKEMMNEQTKATKLYEDKDGLLWISTTNCGLLKLDTKKAKITSISIPNTLPRGYKTENLFASTTNEVWAACGTNGIIRIDTKEKTATTVPIPHRNAISVHTRPDGTIFVGTTKDLMRYDSDRQRLSTLFFSDSASVLEGRVMVRNMNEDCLGNLWLSTHIGLYKYNGLHFERAVIANENENDEFNCVIEDSEGRIWAGSRSGGFVKEPNESIFKRVGKKYEGRNNSGILCLADVGTKVLAGSAGGVMVIDKASKNMTEASFNADFSNCMVYSIQYDAKGIVWLNTSAGIGYVDLNNHTIHKFDQHDGLVLLGNDCQKFCVVDGNLFFGQVSLLNVINTNEVTFNNNIPRALVSEVLYGQSGTERTMKMSNDSTFVSKYAIGAATKIKVASSDYTLPLRNEFMYKVDNGEWTHLRNGSHEIVLSGNLPGTYRVCIRATNADGMWSYEVKTVYIDIDPPMWASRPALIFYAILIMSITWLVLNMRFRNINRKMRRVEEEAKAMTVIKAQRNRLAAINKEQTDSINYAKRIQDALIPHEDGVMEDTFSKFFVFYRPKDIVSGDFYSIYQRGTKTFIIAADCTGHGVPGAFISILGIDHLYNIIMQQKLDDAGEILTKLHSELHDTILRDLEDGMDMTICVVDHAEMKVNFAGAMNDMLLIRNNEVLTFHGDRRSIGGDDSWSVKRQEAPKFTSHYINCEAGDVMYMFSDGFQDQHGGPEGKKFMVRRFKNLLLNIHKLPARDQKTLLNQTFENWRGAHEQTDDVSVVGFEPWPK